MDSKNRRQRRSAKKQPVPQDEALSPSPSNASKPSLVELLSSFTNLLRASTANDSLNDYMGNLPPNALVDFMTNSYNAQRQMGQSITRWPQISRSLNVHKSGVGSDLVDLTTRLWPDPVTFSNRLNMLHEHEAMKCLPGHVQSGLEMRGKSGMRCERTGCLVNNPDKRPAFETGEDSPKVILKRCQGVREFSR